MTVDTSSKWWTEAAKGALALMQVFEQVRTLDGGKKLYGQMDVYEMTAELANADFRQFLKKQSLWSRVVDAIKRILGINTENALDSATLALEKILDGGVSSAVRKSARSKNGLETYTEAQYNGKNDTKGGLIRGESRQETREAFLSRAVQDVLQVKTRGKTAYGYRRTSPADVTERSRQVEEELKKIGVPSVVYDVLEVN